MHRKNDATVQREVLTCSVRVALCTDWARGWSHPPAQGLPQAVKGFTDFNKKSWMTETSGESTRWLDPAPVVSTAISSANSTVLAGLFKRSGRNFPSQGGWSIALKIHQALTTGQQSAWLYWTFADPTGKGVDAFHLTDSILLDKSPKCKTPLRALTCNSPAVILLMWAHGMLVRRCLLPTTMLCS